MGKPESNETIVDPNFKVLGVDGIRIADTSIMGNMGAGRTSTSALFGERLAEMLRVKHSDHYKEKTKTQQQNQI